jgi:hypothetical protein
LCVEVDLTKPLLAIFTIRERQFCVEYEGLHLLCLTCGRFGHYKEGCAEKIIVQNDDGEKNGVGEKANEGGKIADGPWTVVQKPRRQRKVKEKEETGNGSVEVAAEKTVSGKEKIQGSRFAALSDEIPEITVANNVEERLVEEEPIKKKYMKTNRMQQQKFPYTVKSSAYGDINGKKVNETRRGSGGPILTRSTEVTIPATRETRGGGKGINGSEAHAKQVVSAETSRRGEFITQHVDSNDKQDDGVGKVGFNSKSTIWYPWMSTHVESTITPNLGSNEVIKPNVPRPPNLGAAPLLTNQNTSIIRVVNEENEVFQDAAEEGASDQEEVGETPNVRVHEVHAEDMSIN